jgi:hypothetical protein
MLLPPPTCKLLDFVVRSSQVEEPESSIFLRPNPFGVSAGQRQCSPQTPQCIWLLDGDHTVNIKKLEKT